MVKSLPANAGDVGLIPGPGQLSPCATTTEAQVPRVCALKQEKLSP